MKKRFFVCMLVVLLGSNAVAKDYSAIFDAWIGHKLETLVKKMPGNVSYGKNYVLFDNSWNETKQRYVAGDWSSGGKAGEGSERVGMGHYETYQVRHEKWVTFYFNSSHIITSWRSKGY